MGGISRRLGGGRRVWGIYSTCFLTLSQPCFCQGLLRSKTSSPLRQFLSLGDSGSQWVLIIVIPPLLLQPKGGDDVSCW